MPGAGGDAARRRRRARPAPAPTRSWCSAPAAARSRSSRSRATPWPRSRARATNKINAAYAFGGAELQIETVEDFLGIDINHVAIVDFAGFERPHRRDRRRQGGPRRPGLQRDLGRRVRNRSRPRRGDAPARRRSRWRGRARTTCGDTAIDGTTSIAPQFQQLIIHGHQGPPHRPAARSPTTSSRARSSAGTRRRRSSPTWAR